MIALSRRQEAIITLLEQPDPPDLPRRLHAWKYRSPINREAMKSALFVAWMVRREIESLSDGR